MKLNREQGLFVVVLLVVGVMGYLRVGDQYQSKRIPGGKKPQEVEAPIVPIVQLPQPGDATYDPDGRDPFLPPRDWNPLPYVALPWPPLPEIGSIEFVPMPGMQSEALTPLRRAPPGAALAAGSPSATAGPAAGDGDANGKFGGIDFGGGSGGGAASLAADALNFEKTYDWVKRKNVARVWGTIRNADRLGLLDDPAADIDFQAVNPKTGQAQVRYTFPRGELDGGGVFNIGFGFADRVATRVALLERDVRPGVGNAKTQVAAARTCLGWIDDDRDAALEGAEKFLRSALSFSPKDAEAWELLGEVKARGLDTEGELKVYDEAAAAGVESARLLVQRGRLDNRIGLVIEAEEAFREAMKRAPNDHVGFLELGRLLIDTNRGTEAVEVLTTAESRAGTAEERLAARLALARAHIRIGDLSGARTRLEQISRMGIESAPALVLQGALSVIDGDPTQALGSFRSALELNPRSRNATFDSGVALALSMETDPSAAQQARSRFEQAADLDPLTWFDTTVAIGALEERFGNLERASDSYLEALTYHPNHPYGLYHAGRISRRLGDLDGARDQLRTALETDGRLVDVLNELGYVELLADRPREAELYLRESIRRDPGYDQAHVLLGFALLRQNQIRDARAAFEEGVGPEDDPNPAALTGIAWCDYREELVDAALQHFAEARASAGEEFDPFYVYAATHQALIEDNRAKEQWVDRFDRRQIRNNWDIIEAYGPTVTATGEGVKIQGMQRRTDPDESTLLMRPVLGATFVSIESDLVADSKNEAAVGVRFVFERASGKQVLPQGEVAVARFPDGSIRLRVRDDKSTISEDWTTISKAGTVPDGETFTLAIERTDFDKGTFQVLLDGAVLKADIESRSLKKQKRQCDGGVFAFAGGSKNVSVSCDRVRVVRYQE